MKTFIRLVTLLLLAAPAAQSADSVTKQYLRYLYGADGIEISTLCTPSDDVWMLHGRKNAPALTALDALPVEAKTNGIVSGVFGTDMYFIEVRDGKVDPAFNLDGIYLVQRQVIMRFLAAALMREDKMLDRLVTDRAKLSIVGPKAASGDMDQYASILEILPMVRTSKPADDAKTKSVTYRLPLGEKGMTFTLVLEDGIFKIDTSKTLTLPLEFFFREQPTRTVITH